MLFAFDEFDDVVNVAVLPLGQLRFLWYRALVALLAVDGDEAADAFLIRKSILFRSQSGHAFIFSCLATGIISGSDDNDDDGVAAVVIVVVGADDECSNLIAS